MEKFTIADKQDAQCILENNPSLSQDDKDILSRKPVFSVLKSLFEKYYNLELLSVYESDTDILSFTTKPIEKYWPNTEESYVSMVSSKDYLVFGFGKTAKKNTEFSNKFLSEEEVEKMDIDLYREIGGYIDENIVNWTEMCECEDEASSLEFFLDHHLPSWRVRGDGTVDVIVEGESIESFDFEWEDEDGEERISNALDLLRGNVSHEFDEDCNNEFTWDNDLEEKVISLFK